MSPPRANLREHLDALVDQYGGEEFLHTDPLGIPYAYPDPLDRELAAFLAAGLAYGRVDIVLRSCRDALARMGPNPAHFARNFEPRTQARVFDGWVHRFNRGVDLAALLWGFRQIYAKHGSLGALFGRGLAPSDPHIGAALDSFCAAFTAQDFDPVYPGGALPADAGVRWFFARPSDGSACKRLNLFLRWMVRRDGLDLGLWPEVSPAQLLMPLDTHVARICGYLGLSARQTVGWPMVLEVTDKLRELSPHDPVRYDWAICRLGILNACPRKRQAELCSACALFPVCQA
jgi:uncharacterized protein (TIGR02757 family)